MATYGSAATAVVVIVLVAVTHDALSIRPHRQAYTMTGVVPCIAVSGPTVWNTLPSTVRVSTTMLRQFQSGVKTLLFRLAYGT